MANGVILAMPLGGEMHVTVLYFGNANDAGMPSAEALHALLRPVDAPQEAFTTVTAHFGKPGEHAFVHLIESPSLQAAYTFGRALTLPYVKSNYPVYRPHVTISYHETEDEMPPAGEDVSGVRYVAPGLELWYGGVHYPLRDPFPVVGRPLGGTQYDPYRGGFSAAMQSDIEEFYSPTQPRDTNGKWSNGHGVRMTQVSTSHFVEAITQAHSVQKGSVTAGEMLSPPDPHYLRPSRKFLTAGGKAGFVISKEGDLQQVFNASDVRGIGAQMIRTAIDKGAKTLDCFDGFLPGYYAKFGFEEVGREANWTPGGPDVVYMALKSQPLSSSAQTVNSSVEPSSNTNSATTSSSSGDVNSLSVAVPLAVETVRVIIPLEVYP